MSTVNLTDVAIRNYKPQDKPWEVADASSAGLRLRISPKGRKTWYYRYRHPHTGKLQKLTLGIYPDLTLARARVIWAELAAARRRNMDPRGLYRAIQDENAPDQPPTHNQRKNAP